MDLILYHFLPIIHRQSINVVRTCLVVLGVAKHLGSRVNDGRQHKYSNVTDDRGLEVKKEDCLTRVTRLNRHLVDLLCSLAGGYFVG
jgi:hypothetical protein